jgi:hypothetical protein
MRTHMLSGSASLRYMRPSRARFRVFGFTAC